MEGGEVLRCTRRVVALSVHLEALPDQADVLMAGQLPQLGEDLLGGRQEFRIGPLRHFHETRPRDPTGSGLPRFA